MDQIEELKKEHERLVHENEMLKNRCYAQTHGLMCMFCPYGCDNRTIEHRKSEEEEK